MLRLVIPIVITILFFLEPVFSLFSPITYGDWVLTLVPRFVFICLIFIATYVDRKQAIIYGIIFGLLYDVFYIDIIGVYAFLYPVIAFVAAGIIRMIHRNMFMVILVTFLLIALLEVLSYGFASIIALTTISFETFVKGRLIPTMLANGVFIAMFSWFFKKVIVDRVLVKLKED